MSRTTGIKNVNQSVFSCPEQAKNCLADYTEHTGKSTCIVKTTYGRNNDQAEYSFRPIEAVLNPNNRRVVMAICNHKNN